MNFRLALSSLWMALALVIAVGCGGGGLPEASDDVVEEPGAGADAGMDEMDPGIDPDSPPQ